MQKLTRNDGLLIGNAAIFHSGDAVKSSRRTARTADGERTAHVGVCDLFDAEVSLISRRIHYKMRSVTSTWNLFNYAYISKSKENVEYIVNCRTHLRTAYRA